MLPNGGQSKALWNRRMSIPIRGYQELHKTVHDRTEGLHGKIVCDGPTDRNADVTDPTRSGDRHKGSSFRSIGKYWKGPSSSSISCCAATAKKSSEGFDHFHVLHPLRFPAAAIDFSPTRRWTRTGWAGR